MKSSGIALLLIGAVMALSAAAQQPDPAKKKEYETKLKALAKDDWEGKVKLAAWCQENTLPAQAKKLLQEVIKAKPDHEEARKLLGYAKHEGKWILEADLEKIKKAEREKEWKEKGFVKYKNGEWVPAADVPFLDRGMVRHGDIWISKEDKEKLDKGFLLVDGEWVPPEEAENVKNGLHKVGGKWVSLEEANAFHSAWDTPWRLQSAHFELITNLDRQTAEQQKQIVEDCYQKLVGIFKTELRERPPIFYIATEKDYQNLTAKYADDHSSVWAGCIPIAHPQRPAVALYEKNFGPYYLRHAVAHLYIDRIAPQALVPLWFDEAVAGYVSRFHDEYSIGWSKDNLKRRGSLDKMKKYTEDLEISASAQDESQKYLIEAGLLAWYCMEGGNDSLKKAFLDAAAAVVSGKKQNIAKAMDQLLAKSNAIEKNLKELLK